MLLRCSSLPQASGCLRLISGDGSIASTPIYPITIGKVYRPLSLAFRSLRSTLQRLVLLRTDGEVEDGISIAYIEIAHFEVIENFIPRTWSIICNTDAVFEVGVADILRNISWIHQQLACHDDVVTRRILYETNENDYN